MSSEKVVTNIIGESIIIERRSSESLVEIWTEDIITNRVGPSVDLNLSELIQLAAIIQDLITELEQDD
jgi:hypothetical protein